jgi:hypothetical protein
MKYGPSWRLNSKNTTRPNTKRNSGAKRSPKPLFGHPSKALFTEGRRDLGYNMVGDLIAPHAEVLLNPVVRRTMQGLSKKYNLGDMRKGPLFPVFTALGTAGVYTVKEMINYHKRKKRGDFTVS